MAYSNRRASHSSVRVSVNPLYVRMWEPRRLVTGKLKWDCFATIPFLMEKHSGGNTVIKHLSRGGLDKEIGKSSIGSACWSAVPCTRTAHGCVSNSRYWSANVSISSCLQKRLSKSRETWDGGSGFGGSSHNFPVDFMEADDAAAVSKCCLRRNVIMKVACCDSMRLLPRSALDGFVNRGELTCWRFIRN